MSVNSFDTPSTEARPVEATDAVGCIRNKPRWALHATRAALTSNAARSSPPSDRRRRRHRVSRHASRAPTVSATPSTRVVVKEAMHRGDSALDARVKDAAQASAAAPGAVRFEGESLSPVPPSGRAFLHETNAPNALRAEPSSCELSHRRSISYVAPSSLDASSQ